MTENDKDCQEIADMSYGNKPGFIDVALGKAMSRKLLVFMVSTALLFYSDLDPDTWAMIAVIYIGGQSAIDAVKAWKWGGL